MADWYVSSANYAAIPVFAVNTAYTIGQLVRPITPSAVWALYVFRCTTAGTSAATENGWGTAALNNGTVAQGTATFTNVSGQSTYGWSAAAGSVYALMSNQAQGRPLIGDRVFVASDHNEIGTGNMGALVANNGSISWGSVSITSVNRAGSVPPVAADVQSGAIITSGAGGNGISFDTMCAMLWQGFTFTLNNANNFYFNNGTVKTTVFKNCTFVFGPSAASTSKFYNNSGVKLLWDNVTLQFSNAAQAIAFSGYFLDLTWINTPAAIVAATLPTSLFSINGAAIITLRGVDLSALTSTLFAGNTLGWYGFKALLDSCRIAPGVTLLATPATGYAVLDEVELVNCYNGTSVLNERHTYAGDLITDRSTYLSAGAQDDIGGYSLKLASSLRSDLLCYLLDNFSFDIESIAVGASKTATVEVFSAASLNNNDIRLLLEYMGGATATWNPSDKSAAIALSSGNLLATSSSSNTGVRATQGVSSGKFYCEFTVSTSGWVGFALAATPLNSNAIAVAPSSGWIQVNGSSVQNMGGLGNPICVAIDLGAKLAWFRSGTAGNWNGSGTANPATGVGGVSFAAVVGTLFPAVTAMLNGETGILTPVSVAGVVPSGFSLLPTDASNPIASFADSLPSLLTPVAALPSSSNPWTGTIPTTWNPGDASGGLTLSNGNLTATQAGGNNGVRANTALGSGKYYFEITPTALGSGTNTYGIASASAALAAAQTAQYANVSTAGPNLYTNNTFRATLTGTIAVGTAFGIAVDVPNQLIWIRIGANTWNGSGAANPATGVGGFSFSSLTGAPYPMYAPGFGIDGATVNFGATSFANAAPAGFSSPIITPVKQLLQASFTPQRPGRVRGLVRLGKTTTAWVNPQLTIG
jgi:hypothetical protein